MRIFLAIGFVIVFASIFLFLYLMGQKQEAVVSFNGVSFEVEIVETKSDRIRGLSGKREIDDSQGLILKFDREDFHGIWMRNMLFDIDIIWLSSDLIVVDIKEEASKKSYPETFYPQEKALYVLEINAGLAQEKGIVVGSKAEMGR